jgi:hypothetical protein
MKRAVFGTHHSISEAQSLALPLSYHDREHALAYNKRWADVSKSIAPFA